MSRLLTSALIAAGILSGAVWVSAPSMAQDQVPAVTPPESAPAIDITPASPVDVSPAQMDVASIPATPATPVAPSATAFPAPVTPIEKGIADQIGLLEPTIDVNSMPSLMFSTWEHDLIIDARRGLNTGTAILDIDSIPEDERIAGPREVALGGIVFNSGKDWTIWLNGIRITPKAIPQPVMNLKVFKNHIELDWLDTSTNQIFPIRLRAHERFNLDTRIFLPG